MTLPGCCLRTSCFCRSLLSSEINRVGVLWRITGQNSFYSFKRKKSYELNRAKYPWNIINFSLCNTWSYEILIANICNLNTRNIINIKTWNIIKIKTWNNFLTKKRKNEFLSIYHKDRFRSANNAIADKSKIFMFLLWKKM